MVIDQLTTDIRARVEQYAYPPESRLWHFAADIVRICANHADNSIRCLEDAMNIPTMLDEASVRLHRRGCDAHGLETLKRRYYCEDR